MLQFCMPPRSDIQTRLVSGKACIHRQWKVFFSSYASCDVYNVHSTWKRHRSSYIHTSPPGLTIATVSNAGVPKKWTEELQHAMNAAAHILTQTKKCDRGLTRILHDELHWIDVSEHTQFKLCIHVYKCPHGIAPKYIMNLCRPVSAIEGHSHLHSVARGQLNVPCPKLSTYGRKAFTYAGQSA